MWVIEQVEANSLLPELCYIVSFDGTNNTICDSNTVVVFRRAEAMRVADILNTQIDWAMLRLRDES